MNSWTVSSIALHNALTLSDKDTAPVISCHCHWNCYWSLGGVVIRIWICLLARLCHWFRFNLLFSWVVVFRMNTYSIWHWNTITKRFPHQKVFIFTPTLWTLVTNMTQLLVGFAYVIFARLHSCYVIPFHMTPPYLRILK